MSKALEVIKNNVDIKKALGFAQACGYHADVQYALEKAVKLEQALTPPTEQEVCEALGEYLKRDVKYDGEYFYYSEEKRYYGECDEIICGWSYSPKELSFEKNLPPHLVTMIGKFYEGKVKE